MHHSAKRKRSRAEIPQPPDGKMENEFGVKLYEKNDVLVNAYPCDQCRETPHIGRGDREVQHRRKRASYIFKKIR